MINDFLFMQMNNRIFNGPFGSDCLDIVLASIRGNECLEDKVTIIFLTKNIIFKVMKVRQV